MKLNLFYFLICFSLIVYAQDIEKHKWKNRVLLVVSNDKNIDDFKNQIQVLKDKFSEFEERKLIIYQITKNKYSFNFNDNWVLSSKFDQEFNKEKSPFKVILIGLDGDIKLSQSAILSAEKLFTIIDGMPMRKREIRKTNK